MASRSRAASRSSTTSAPIAGGKYERKRAVTLPVFKVEEEKSLYLHVNAAMYIGKEQKAQPGKKQMEPATIMPVTNIETGEQGQIIVNAALKSILDESYPNASYVDKKFEVIKHAKKDGKRYHTFSVFEIEA